MHAPLEQPRMPPSNHTHPSPGATMHALPVNRMTNWCKNITLPQTSFAGGNKPIAKNRCFFLFIISHQSRTRMHSSRMCTACSLTVSCRILCNPPWQPLQPCMPPHNHAPPSSHACPLQPHMPPPATMHARRNNAHPPPSNHTCHPQPCTPSSNHTCPPATMHPLATTHAP